MQLPFGFVSRDIQGGPYLKRPKDTFGVKLAVEINEPCDVSIPSPDFGLPPDKAQVREALRVVLRKLALRESVYAGCMGGVGRTGLFLALLAKVLGVAKPVFYVRRHYNSHAVETEEQRVYVDTFDVSPLFWDALAAKGTALYVDTLRFFTGHPKA